VAWRGWHSSRGWPLIRAGSGWRVRREGEDELAEAEAEALAPGVRGSPRQNSNWRHMLQPCES